MSSCQSESESLALLGVLLRDSRLCSKRPSFDSEFLESFVSPAVHSTSFYRVSTTDHAITDEPSLHTSEYQAHSYHPNSAA